MDNQQYIDVEATIVSDEQITENVVQAYRYSKSVKVFSIIDFVFSVIYFLSYATYYFLFTCLISLMGYYGATQFNTCYSKTYLIWNMFALLLQTVLFISFINDNYGNLSNDNSFAIYFLIGFLSISLKFWVTKMIYSFNKYLTSLNQSETETIKNIDNRLHMVGIYYW